MAETRKKKLYTPLQNEPFDISRTKIELFMKCPRCFYLDRSEKYRKSRPSSPMSYIPALAAAFIASTPKPLVTATIVTWLEDLEETISRILPTRSATS